MLTRIKVVVFLLVLVIPIVVFAEGPGAPSPAQGTGWGVGTRPESHRNLLAHLFLRPPPRLPGEFRPPPVLQDRPGYWEGAKDGVLMERIRTQPIRRITVNAAGSSISVRLHLADGSSAAFKPEQIHIQSVPRKEIAAYAVNRLLGLARVPPASYRVVPEKEFYKRLRASRWWHRRMKREIRARKDGMLAGEVSWWIPRIRCYPLERWEYRKHWHQWLKAYKREPRRHYRMAAQISAMLLFDFVINNMDRFTGCNVQSTVNRKHLYFMDNTMSFWTQARGGKNARTGLHRVQRFSRKVYRNLKALSEDRLRRALGRHKGAPWPVLTEKEIHMVMKRREFALRYIHRVIALHGWEKTMIFP